MTRARPARRRRRVREGGLEAAAFPALRAFARAYLHEDLMPTHGSAVAALLAFAAEAQPAEREALVADLDRLAAATGPLAWPKVVTFIQDDLGAHWLPAGPDDVRMLAAVLRQRG